MDMGCSSPKCETHHPLYFGQAFVADLEQVEVVPCARYSKLHDLDEICFMLSNLSKDGSGLILLLSLGPAELFSTTDREAYEIRQVFAAA